MPKYFSSSYRAFFDSAIHGPRDIAQPQTDAAKKAGKRPVMVPNKATLIPDDAVEISDEQHAALMAQIGEGRVLTSRKGQPVTVAWEQSAEDRIAANRRRRDGLLAASDYTQLPDSPLSDEERRAWQEYRQALRDIDLAGEDDWPQLRTFLAAASVEEI